MVSSSSFENELRKALNHLYEPAHLRQSPLLVWLGLQGSANTAAALRDALLSTIEELNPEQTSGSVAGGGQDYQVLFYRYVQRLTQQNAAHQLAVSPRHLRRMQADALQALAGHLRERFNLLESLPDSSDAASATEAELDRELLFLSDRLSGEYATMEPVLAETLGLVQSLAHRQGVQIESTLSAGLSPVAVPEMVLKEIMLNLLVPAVQALLGGKVSVIVEEIGSAVTLEVRAEAAMTGPPQQVEWDPEALEMVRRLTELSKGDFAVLHAVDRGVLRARVSLPVGEHIAVLAIEDNVDTLQLWERYLQGSRFHLIGETQTDRAMATALRVEPALIVLDLMMPGVDGWKLLAQLHNHPDTSAIPIIVCTVLPHRELALSLGASAFIRKPTTRQAFLAALQRQSAAAGRA